jgi:hypothetical protein
LRSVAYGNGTYVAVGEGGTIITSPDGGTWDVQDSGVTLMLNRVQFLNGQFFAVGQAGTILSSGDGINWQSQNSGTARTLYGVTFGSGRFVATGFDEGSVYPDPQDLQVSFFRILNVFLSSTNGSDWTDITTKVPASHGMEGISFLNGSFWTWGEVGAILQSDSVDGRPILGGAMLADRSGFQLRPALNPPPTYRIQVNTNLNFPWQDAATLTNSTSPTGWIDTNIASSPTRLYRIAAP